MDDQQLNKLLNVTAFAALVTTSSEIHKQSIDLVKKCALINLNEYDAAQFGDLVERITKMEWHLKDLKVMVIEQGQEIKKRGV